MKKIYLYMIALIALPLVFTSCEDMMDDVNEDRNHTTEVPAKFILSDLITSTAFNAVGGDLSTYFSTYSELEVGTHNQLYNAEMRIGEPARPATYNNIWGTLFANIKDARIIIARCSDGGPQEGNYTTKGMGEVLLALNSAILTDAFGDVPYFQAALPELKDGQPQFLNPKMDKQEAIYAEIFKLLDAAIVDLPKGDNHPSGSPLAFDFLYKSDADSWIKLAKGLKARYLMRTLNRASDETAALTEIITLCDASFASADEDAEFAIYDASNINPLHGFWWARYGVAASKSYVDKLIARNDTLRLRREFVDEATWAQIKGKDDAAMNPGPNGNVTQSQAEYTSSICFYGQTAPTFIMSYHELLFIKAEAMVRKGSAVTAKPVLKAAYIAAIANMERTVKAAFACPNALQYGGITETTTAVTGAEAADFFDTVIDPLFTANPLKETMLQKYFACHGANGEAQEAYHDIIRTKAAGEDFYGLANTGKFPLRAGYGNDDTTTNPEVKEAFGDGNYVYTENVWWALGSR